MANAQYIRGPRGGQLLNYNGEIYKKKKEKGGKDYYQCDNKACRVTLHTLAGGLAVIHNNGEHRHPPPDDLIASAAIMEEAKRRITADPTKHVPLIWEDVLDWYERRHNNAILPEFIDFKSSQIYHNPSSKL